MPAGVSAVDGVTTAVGVGQLVKLRVPRQKAHQGRVVVAVPHLLERVRRADACRSHSVLPVAGPRVPRKGGSRAGGHRPHPEGVWRVGGRDGLGGVGREAHVPPTVFQRVLPVAPDEAVALGILRRVRPVRLFNQDRAAVQIVADHCPVHRFVYWFQRGRHQLLLS